LTSTRVHPKDFAFLATGDSATSSYSRATRFDVGTVLTKEGTERCEGTSLSAANTDGYPRSTCVHIQVLTRQDEGLGCNELEHSGRSELAIDTVLTAIE